MLLAVIDLLESGDLSSNKIELNATLESKFRAHFELMRTGRDQPNAYLPFFHLKSESFWHHFVRSGNREDYDALSKSASASRVRNSIEYAFLDDELFGYLRNSIGRETLKAALFENIDENQRDDLRGAIQGWSPQECEIITRDYLDMLSKELAGIAFSKAEHRRALLGLLNNRTEGSIEYKYQNLSAVLLDLGLPYVAGYKPAFNYQRLLGDIVEAQVVGKYDRLDSLINSRPESRPDMALVDWTAVLANPPERVNRSGGIPQRDPVPRRYNYAEREIRNRRLGEDGEAFALEFEKYRLTQAGLRKLARSVRWTSRDEGDGAGYDIRSFELDSKEEIFIEVKTTTGGKFQPFYISANEVAFSEENAAHYALYRVFAFARRPQIFVLSGNIHRHVELSPTEYSARIG
ncbi:MAG: DUF3883 domain-containing protein [Gammaproteobacteria bacterium]|nr:DUF3883 domain-containing protein [Gammaproteobacteria bacterium]